MVTLADVAQKANVSKMTVSRVINHPKQVTDELKELTLKAMRDLNYHPNVAAIALANNCTNVVKLSILEDPETTEPYYMNLLIGIANKLSASNYTLGLVTKKGIDINDSCDGYIITGMREHDYEWIDRVEKPIVMFGENTHGYSFVDIDNKEAISVLVSYALKKGYENIVYIGIDVCEPFEILREDGYIDMIQRERKRPRIFRVENCSSKSEDLIIKNWRKYKTNTCFICSSDYIALGVERAISKMGGSIPNEYGVTGFDGIFLDQIASPKLTTISQSVSKIGEICAELLIRKLKGNGSPVSNVRLKPTMVVRDSTR
jgi:DNA-binding LacI/PurR family transcriptional regulator